MVGIESMLMEVAFGMAVFMVFSCPAPFEPYQAKFQEVRQLGE